MSVPAAAPRALLAAAALALAACGACGGRGAAPERRYAVRAEVLKLPDAGAAGAAREIVLRHEAIDAFQDQAGKVVGMDAMVMRFGLGPAVSLEGVRVGDKVEAVIAVAWAPPALRVDSVRRLPDDTALSFGRARPPAAPAR